MSANAPIAKNEAVPGRLISPPPTRRDEWPYTGKRRRAGAISGRQRTPTDRRRWLEAAGWFVLGGGTKESRRMVGFGLSPWWNSCGGNNIKNTNCGKYIHLWLKL